MDDAMVEFVGLQYGDRSAPNTLIHVPAPPANWMAPGFDDGSWLRQRLPHGLGDHHGRIGRGSTLNQARACFRFRFRVPDPNKAERLTLRLAYAGGVVVYLNGTELARGHLPEGKLGRDAAAEAYPLEAYVLLGEDGSIRLSTHRRDKGRPLYVGKLRTPFDKALKYHNRKERKTYDTLRHTDNGRRKGKVLNREQWERIQTARGRRLGPIPVPARLLRKGENILAVDVRAAPLHPIAARWETMAIRANEGWWHCRLIHLNLTDPTGAVPSAMRRPAGVQVWAEDMHRRMISTEYGEPQGNPGVVRFVGAANGHFSAQIVVSTDRELTGLVAEASELKNPAGATLPAAALTVSYLHPHPLTDLVKTGGGRGGPAYQKHPLIGPVRRAIQRHGPARDGGKPRSREELLELAGRMDYFDHITAAAPAAVPANSCRPLWLALTVPPDTAPDTYRGTLTVRANGMDPVALPVVAEIAGWRLPDPLDFQLVAALEQSPYGVAKHYDVPLWSDEHFERMEGSFRQLARIGNDWLFVPVVAQTEFGNHRDSMIRWTRRKDKRLAFDFSRLDRYLDLAVGHLGPPRVICFVVVIGAGGNPGYVMVRDEATGKVEPLDLSKNTLPHYKKTWQTFATALYQHMRSKGLHESMYWGYGWDALADRDLPITLAKVTPDVKWASGGHRPCSGHYFTANSRIYDISLTAQSARGWRRKDIELYNPRGGGSLIALSGPTLPFNYRLLPDRCIVVGLNGFSRMGADYWANVFLQGLRAEGFLRPGMALSSVLYPGDRGAESCARFEALLEGIQEAEARIFLEQALTRKALPEKLAGKVQRVLTEHHRGTLVVPSGSDYPRITETMVDWQARSRRLFGAAAEAAAAVGLDVATPQLTVDVPARVQKPVTLKLRCWTSTARAFTAAADAPWLQLGKTAGEVRGHLPLTLSVDAARLEPGKTAKATVTVTDAVSGKARPVAVTARVSKVFDFVPPDRALSRREYRFIPDEGKVVLSVAPGKAETQEIVFFNRAGTPVKWQAAAAVPWVSIRPSEGEAAPGSGVVLEVTVKPPMKTLASVPADLTISEPGGPARQTIPVVCTVVPPYADPPPLPKGTPVTLDAELHKKLLTSHAAMKPRWCGHRHYYVSTWDPPKDVRGTKAARYHLGTTPAQTTYNLTGREFTAFSAEVGMGKLTEGYSYWTGYRNPVPDWIEVRLEAYVDGELRACSGWMKKTDPLRRLVVPDLAGAKELRLVSRFRKIPPYSVTSGWLNARFYKAE
jgi:hypothetical protein